MQLPSLALVKLQRLQQSEADARDAASTVSRRLSDTNRALATAPASEYANIEAESARLLSRQADLAAKHRALADINAALTRWLSTATGTLEYVKPAKAVLQKGETISAAIIRLRERIGVLSAERTKVMQCRVPASDLKASAIQYVDALALRGSPRIIIADHARIEVKFDGAVTWEDQGLAAKMPAILAWLDPEAFKKRLSESIDKMPEPPLTMTGKAKAERLVVLEAELLQLERVEEALVTSCEEGEGPLVMRRLLADPRAVLCLGTIQPKAVKPERKVERVKADDAV